MTSCGTKVDFETSCASISSSVNLQEGERRDKERPNRHTRPVNIFHLTVLHRAPSQRRCGMPEGRHSGVCVRALGTTGAPPLPLARRPSAPPFPPRQIWAAAPIFTGRSKRERRAASLPGVTYGRREHELLRKVPAAPRRPHIPKTSKKTEGRGAGQGGGEEAREGVRL